MKTKLLTIFLLLFTSQVFAEEYSSIKNDEVLKEDTKNIISFSDGKFFTNAGEIPLGCFSELMIELNGDDIVAAVYLNRTVLRGCIDSNKHLLGENENYRLSVEKEQGNNVFWIKICESVDGSMGSTCGKLIIQFVKRQYLTPDGNKEVVSVEKLGKWK